MIRFNSQTIEDLQEEAWEKRFELSKEIIKSVCDALDEDADYVSVGIFGDFAQMGLMISKSNYLNALNLNLHRCEEIEEYELCKRAKDWIDKLNKDLSNLDGDL